MWQYLWHYLPRNYSIIYLNSLAILIECEDCHNFNDMKKSSYIIVVRHAGYVICYNAFTNTLLCVSNNVYQAFEELDAVKFKMKYEKHYSAFLQNGFYIDDERNELDEIRFNYKQEAFGHNRNFRLMVFPTQDCNLKCWYCYENHKPNTKMEHVVMENVIRYASNVIAKVEIESFVLSFFGGEPLLFFDEIAYPLSVRIKKMCDESGIRFTTFFVTNGTFVTKENIKLFQEINSVFQITLDGCREKHNMVRIQKRQNLPTYDKIIESLYLISENVETTVDDQMVTLRINYDNQTLKKIGELVNDIKGLDRRKFLIHFERVWQTQDSSEDENQKLLLLNAVRLFIQNGFIVNIGNFKNRNVSCLAENHNFAIINYDGLVYKCNGRTLSPDYAEGKLLDNGTIEWNRTALARRLGKSTFENPMCLKCKMLPVCMGPCSQKCMELNWQNLHQVCSLKSIGMSLDNYLTQRAEQVFVAKQLINKE